MPNTAADLWWDAAPLPATPPAAPGAPAEVAGGQAQPSPALPLPCHCWMGLTLCRAPPCCRGSPASDACSRGVTALGLPVTFRVEIVDRPESGKCIDLGQQEWMTQCCMSWVCPAGWPAADSTTKLLENKCLLKMLQHVPDNAAETLLPPGSLSVHHLVTHCYHLADRPGPLCAPATSLGARFWQLGGPMALLGSSRAPRFHCAPFRLACRPHGRPLPHQRRPRPDAASSQAALDLYAGAGCTVRLPNTPSCRLDSRVHRSSLRWPITVHIQNQAAQPPFRTEATDPCAGLLQ